MPVMITPETKSDWSGIDHVHHLAFGGDAEGCLVRLLRNDGFVSLSLVAKVDDHVVGHLLFSQIAIVTDEKRVPALSLAPLGVLPDFQRQGIGSRLMEEGLKRCQSSGDRIVLVLGQPEFYSRFGFSAELAKPLTSPFGGGPAWMALELVPDALRGIHGEAEFSPPFNALAMD